MGLGKRFLIFMPPHCIPLQGFGHLVCAIQPGGLLRAVRFPTAQHLRAEFGPDHSGACMP